MPALERVGARLRARRRAPRARGGDLLARARAARGVDLGGDARGAAAAGHRRRRAPAARGGIDAHRARFGADWRGGFWLPECAHARVARPAARGGRRARDVRRPDRRLRARVAPSTCGRCAARRASRSCRSTARRSSWCGATHGYPARRRLPRLPRAHARCDHKPWAIDGDALRPRARARAQARAARRRLRRARAACEPREAGGEALRRLRARHRAARALVVRGPAVAARRSSRSASARGSRSSHLDDALAERREPRRRAAPTLPVTTLGHAARPLDVGAARASRTSPGARARAELALRRRRRATRAPRAVRELLALQSSDWAFLVRRDLAAAYGHARAAGHRDRARRRAGRARLPARRSCATSRPRRRRRRCCTDDDPARPDPLLGVPADRRGRPGAPRAQARRGPRRARASRSTCSRAAARDTPARRGRRRRRTSTASPSRPCPRDLDAFVAWVDADERATCSRAGARARRGALDLVHGHDWLVAEAADALADALGVPYVTTIHATEYGRHQGWVDKHPQSHIHARRALDGAPRRPRDHLLALHARPRRRRLRPRRGRASRVIPNGIDPTDLQPVDDLDALRARFAAPDEQLVLLVGRLVYEKGFQLALDALPGADPRALGDVRFLVAGSRHRTRPSSRSRPRELGPRRARHVPGLDRRRRPALALPDRRPARGAVDLRAVRPRRARGDGLRLPVHRRRHRRPARGRAQRSDVGLRFRARDAALAGAWSSACSPTTTLRDRLVTEASEHVLRFDWADIARQTAALYAVVASGSRTRARLVS